MFETFVFGTQAQTANANTFDADISASPTDCSFPSTTSLEPSCPSPKPGPLSEIVDQLSQQTLRPDDDELPQQSIWNNSNMSTPAFDNPMDEFSIEELSYVSATRGVVALPHHTTQSLPTLPSLHPSRGTVACRRLQRQLNVQMQSSAGHMKDLSTLVEGMVSTQSQCRLLKPIVSRTTTSKYSPQEELDDSPFNSPNYEPTPPITPDDEGFAEMDEDDLLGVDEAVTLRRASAPNGIRKYNLVRWRKSADCVKAVNSQGKNMVRNVTRMRRRPQGREAGCASAS